MKKFQLYLGAGLVVIVVLTALISLVWTPYDPIQAFPHSALEGPSWPVSYTHLTLPTICSV